MGNLPKFARTRPTARAYSISAQRRRELFPHGGTVFLRDSDQARCALIHDRGDVFATTAATQYAMAGHIPRVPDVLTSAS